MVFRAILLADSKKIAQVALSCVRSAGPFRLIWIPCSHDPAPLRILWNHP
ncbi:hypothetical protein ATPR_1357 [Acetobacter tropicalis NBRC 101654]|uniref:Uncharacterized protein n=1 Tax=Acetobacter tropicalis NBRC 101654 TaxID=749388 RepID=F7VDA8_9PROT|nr:hypothetical protein ATPR_1357 [Acetobacter tropicalis NBRC 101654]